MYLTIQILTAMEKRWGGVEISRTPAHLVPFLSKREMIH